MSREPRRATASEIFRYAFGGLGSNVAYILMMSYLTYYMTDVFGISAYAISGLMLAARIIDAVTDPMMGMIADRTRSKLGRFRPYLIFGAPVLGFTIYLLFCSPNIPESGKVFYAYLMYILYSLASTVCNIPYHALTPIMTNDAAQRTTVVTAKQSMNVPSSLSASSEMELSAGEDMDCLSPSLRSLRSGSAHGEPERRIRWMSFRRQRRRFRSSRSFH